MSSCILSAEELFERSKQNSHVSEHYVFHYPPNSLAEKDILLIAQTQESCFAKICQTLQITYPEKIHYYFSDSPKEIGSIFWEEGTACNGCALYGKHKIYAVYNETVKCIGSHEDTHLISYRIGYPASDFIVEGLAMFMHGLWWGIPNEVWAAYHKQRQAYPTIQALLDNDTFWEYRDHITYPLAGAFTKFLIDHYGLEAYMKLYRYEGTDYDRIYPSIFGLSLQKLESVFWDKLNKLEYDKRLLEKALEQEGV